MTQKDMQLESITRIVEPLLPNRHRALFELEGKPIVYMDIPIDAPEHATVHFDDVLIDSPTDVIEYMQSMLNGLSEALEQYKNRRNRLEQGQES
jgi:hypothetical protein